MQTNLKTIGEYVLLVILSGVLILKGIVPGWQNIHSDFSNYYVSAKLITDRTSLENIYDNAWFHERIKEYGIDTPGKFSPFPPITAFILLPLTSFAPLTAQQIFVVANLLFFGLGAFLLKKITTWNYRQCGLIILMGGLGLINNFAFGQVYWIMTVFILLALYWDENKHPMLAGIILGFFTALKYFPIVFICGFFLNGIFQATSKEEKPERNHDLKVAAGATTALALLIVIQFLFFGPKVMGEYFHASFLPHLDGQLSGQDYFSFYFQTWDSFLRNIFTYHPEFNPDPFINWAMGRLLFKTVIVSLIAGSMTYTFYKARLQTNQVRRVIFISLPALAALVLLPASATYHFILLLIPVVLVAKDKLLEKRFIISILILYFLIGFIPYCLAFSLGKSVSILFAYPRLWLITLLYLLVLLGLNRNLKASSEKISGF